MFSLMDTVRDGKDELDIHREILGNRQCSRKTAAALLKTATEENSQITYKHGSKHSSNYSTFYTRQQHNNMFLTSVFTKSYDHKAHYIPR